jgi:N-acetylneuraminic acid mutarotase
LNCTIRISISFLTGTLFLLVAETFSQGWQQIQSFPGVPRDDATAVTTFETGYYGTGFGNGFIAMNDWWKFDSSTETWTQLSSLPGSPRQYAASIPINDTIYLFGGISQDGIALNDMWAYSTTSDTWIQKKSFPGSGRQSPVFFRHNNFIVCGLGSNGVDYYNDLWIFEPNSNTWSQQPDFPFGARYEAHGFSLNGYWGIGSGRNAAVSFTDWYWYNPVAIHWTNDPDYENQAVWYSASTVSAAGIFIYGGLDSLNDFTNELFVFSDGEWKNISTLNAAPRRGASLLTFTDKIILVGGLDQLNVRLNECWKLTTSTEAPIYNLFPNPATSQVILEKFSGYSGDEIFELFTSEGKLVLEKTTIAVYDRIIIDIPSLEKGFYYCRLRRNEEILFYSPVLVMR